MKKVFLTILLSSWCFALLALEGNLSCGKMLGLEKSTEISTGMILEAVQMDSLNMRLVGQWPFGPSNAVAVDAEQHIAALGSGGGIIILDITEETTPTRISELKTPGSVYDLWYDHPHLFVADGDGGLRIFSLLDPQYPIEIASLPGISSCCVLAVCVSGSLAYLACSYDGLKIASIEDPYHPFEVGSFDVSYSAYDVAVSESYAYVADGEGGLQIVSVEDPTSPYGISSFHPDSPSEPSYVTKVVASYPFIYISNVGGFPDYFSQCVIVSVEDSTNPFEVGAFSTYGNDPVPFLSDSLLYIADGSYGLHIVSVENPQEPIKIGSFDTNGTSNDMMVIETYAYLSDYTGGFRVLSVDPPDSPFEVGYYQTPGSTRDIAVSGSFAYLATESGLRALDIATLSDPREIGNCDSPGWINEIVVQDSFAYAAAGSHGLSVISINDPSNPHEISSYQMSSYAYGIAVIDTDILGLASFHDGVVIISVQDPENPQEIGNFPISHRTEGFDASGLYGYAAAQDGLYTLDVSDPGNPVQLGFLGIDDLRSVKVSGNYAYLPFYGGLRIVRVTSPYDPLLVGFFSGVSTSDVDLWKSVAFIADWSSLKAVNIGYPRHPELTGKYVPGGPVIGVDTEDSLVFAACGEMGMAILEYFGPSAIDVDSLTHEVLPKSFLLDQNFPNPFNPSTTICFTVPDVGDEVDLELTIFDMRGRAVRHLLDDEFLPGSHSVIWDGKDNYGGFVSSGIYLYTLRSGNNTYTKKMTVLK